MIKKGDRGYLDKQHSAALRKFIIYGAVTFLLGLCTWVIFPQYGMVFLVLAVISAIPTAMSAVSLIMYLRFRSIGEDEYLRISEAGGRILLFYDSVITTTEKSYPVPCIGVINKNVMLYSPVEGNDEKALIRHLTLTAKKNGFKDLNIRVFGNIDEFEKRLKYLNGQNIKVLKNDEGVIALLSTLSL